MHEYNGLPLEVKNIFSKLERNLSLFKMTVILLYPFLMGYAFSHKDYHYILAIVVTAFLQHKIYCVARIYRAHMIGIMKRHMIAMQQQNDDSES